MLKNSIIALLWKSKLISSFEDGTPQPSNYTKTISVKATSFAQCLYVLEKVGTARLAVLPRWLATLRHISWWGRAAGGWQTCFPIYLLPDGNKDVEIWRYCRMWLRCLDEHVWFTHSF